VVENKTLVNIDLSNNFIQDGTSIAGVLKDNTVIEMMNLKDNKIKEHTGPLFVEVSRQKSNLLKLNLELNHINIKHMEEIKANLQKNNEFYYRSKAPTIKKEIEKLVSGAKDMNEIYDEVNKRKKEKLKILNKIQQLKAKVMELKTVPDVRLTDLQNQYKETRDKSLTLSIELDQIQKEMTKLRFSEEKKIREKQDEIGRIAADLKQFEKKSK
jgi:hypothetical protein